VTFRYKDYRIDGPGRYKTMTLATDEFIRRFLIHVLPKRRFHRIRHYGLLASGNRAANIARARELLATPSPSKEPELSEPTATDEGSLRKPGHRRIDKAKKGRRSFCPTMWTEVAANSGFVRFTR